MVKSDTPALRRSAVIGVSCALGVAILALVLPTPAGLSPQGKHLAAVFGIALILWVTEAIPIAVTALLVVVLQPIFQVTSARTAITSFMSPVFFFVLAMFCIAQVVADAGLARRFALYLLARAGNDSRRVVLAFMVGAATMSTVVSDVPVTAVWMSMALPLLARTGAAPGRSALGKALMIGIPVAALIGGVGTPAGSSINILGLYQIEQYGKVHVPFLSWMAIGLPMVLVLIPVSWWIIVRCFPPEVDTIGQPSEVVAERRDLGRLTLNEQKTLALFSVMLLLWILSTWVSQIDITIVATAGAVAMFMPGINLLTWRRAERTMGWEALLLIGGVTSLGEASASTGLAKYLVDQLPAMHTWSPAGVVALISVVTVLIHLPLTVNPVVVSVLIPPIAALALSSGRNPALYTLPVVFTASCAFLLPLDAVPVMTYSKGYYRMIDMLRSGAIISLVWVALMTLLLVWVAPALGIL